MNPPTPHAPSAGLSAERLADIKAMERPETHHFSKDRRRIDFWAVRDLLRELDRLSARNFEAVATATSLAISLSQMILREESTAQKPGDGNASPTGAKSNPYNIALRAYHTFSGEAPDLCCAAEIQELADQIKAYAEQFAAGEGQNK